MAEGRTFDCRIYQESLPPLITQIASTRITRKYPYTGIFLVKFLVFLALKIAMLPPNR